MTKTERALLIIAGVCPAWPHWKLFVPTKLPARDKRLYTVAQWKNYLNAIVRKAVCHWLGKKLGGIDDLRSFFRDTRPKEYVRDSTMKSSMLMEPGPGGTGVLRGTAMDGDRHD